MAEPRYPKRNRRVSFALEPYVVDYNSDDDLNLDIDHEEELVDNISDLSDAGSDDETLSNSTVISYMDGSTEDFQSSIGGDGTVWTDLNSSIPCDNKPIDHVPSLTTFSDKATTMLEFFSLFFSDSIYTHILEMTNQKLKLYLDTHPAQSLQNRYLDLISLKELKAFVGLLILIGAFRACREPIHDLYSDDMNFGRPILRATMPRERFKTILRFLRFDDQSTRVERVLIDNLAPIKFVFESVNDAFHSAYNPGKYVCLDEHLCRYRGRCKFMQYLPNKPDKYGLKCWVIADPRNFYPINVEPYTGKNSPHSNKIEDVIMRMVSKLRPGHVIVADNYFTSLTVVNRLFNERNLFYLGTVAKHRKFLPRCISNVKNLPIYSSDFYYNDKNALVSYIRKKNKNVLLLSNIHPTPEISLTIKKKPQMILDYNCNRSGVDKVDQMLKEYRPYRTTRRWPCVLFFDLIAFATQAAWVLYCLKFPDYSICKSKNRKQFLYILGRELVTPLMLLRRESSSFRYFTNDVKEMINSIYTQNKKNTPVGISQIRNFSHTSVSIISPSPITESSNLASNTVAIQAPITEASNLTYNTIAIQAPITESSNLASNTVAIQAPITEASNLTYNTIAIQVPISEASNLASNIVTIQAPITEASDLVPDTIGTAFFPAPIPGISGLIDNTIDFSTPVLGVATSPIPEVATSDMVSDTTGISAQSPAPMTGASDLISPIVQLPRVGRCNFCKRNDDKKTRKRCEMCFSFVCVSHCKVVYLCLNCEDNILLT